MAEYLFQAVRSGGNALQSVNPSVTETPMVDAGGMVVYWFLSPEQHVVELVLLNALLFAIIIRYGRQWSIDIPKISDPACKIIRDGRVTSASTGITTPTSTRRISWLDVADYSFRVLCFVHAIATIAYKASTGRTAYLFQPCHVSNYLLCWLCLTKSDFASKWFYFYVNLWYATLLALSMPDLRGLHRPGELLNFFGQHIMLLILPGIWIAKRRYHMYKGFKLTLVMWAWAFLLHLDVCFPASVLGGANVNYMMVPPKQFPRWFFPQMYRPIVGLFCILLTVFARYALTELVIWITGMRKFRTTHAPSVELTVNVASKVPRIVDIPESPILAPVALSDDSQSPSPPRRTSARLRNAKKLQRAD